MKSNEYPKDKRANCFFNPVYIFSHLWQYRHLILRMAKREVLARYKGSFIGIGWAVIQPIMMLCVYTFVFSVIFKAKWGVGGDETRAEFALTLFIGIITFNLFAETINLAPTLVLGNVNYVKKVVFPLEILPLVSFISVFVHAALSLVAFGSGMMLLMFHKISWTVFVLPIAWLPIMLFSLGIAYFLASIGVFIRDISATIGVFTTVLFFLSPIFYPIHAVPPRFQVICRLNPISVFVEDARRVTLWGMLPDWPSFCIWSLFSMLVLVLGFVWFYKSKKAFADVI